MTLLTPLSRRVLGYLRTYAFPYMALREAAEWVGCSAVEVGRVNRPDLESRLRSALS